MSLEKFYVIGDTHIGRSFTRGVPLHRRGDREQLFKDKFLDELKKGELSNTLGIIMLGDLFDKYRVGFADLLWVVDALNKTKKIIYILAGNHDKSKNKSVIDNFHLLRRMVGAHVNLIEEKAIAFEIEAQKYLLVPYGAELPEQGSYYRIYGHFEDYEYPKVESLIAPGGKAFAGHIHKPELVGRIERVGSILPLAFGEEAKPEMMLTLTKEEIEATPDAWANKCLRVTGGGELPYNINCLQLIPYKDKEDSQEEDSIDVEVGDYDIEAMFHEALDELGLFEEFYNLYLEGKCLED